MLTKRALLSNRICKHKILAYKVHICSSKKHEKTNMDGTNDAYEKLNVICKQ